MKLVWVFLTAVILCSCIKRENKGTTIQEDSSTHNQAQKQKQTKPDLPVVEIKRIFDSAFTSLPSIQLPVILNLDSMKIDSAAPRLNPKQIQALLPREMKLYDKPQRIYVVEKWDDGKDLQGIFYLMKYPEEEDFPPPIDLILVLYDGDGRPTDYKSVSLSESASGSFTKIISPERIIHFSRAEMEFIQMVMTIHAIRGHKFVEIVKKIREYPSKDYEKGEAYQDSVLHLN